MTTSPYIEPALMSASAGGSRREWRQYGALGKTSMLLLHGIGSNSKSWAGQFAALGADRLVVAWNAPGYVGSDPLPTPWPLAGDYAKAALDLMNHLDAGRWIVVGQSLGAIMASALARLVPDRVAGLILVSPASGYGVNENAGMPDKIATRIRDFEELGSDNFAAKRAAALLTPAASSEARRIVISCMTDVNIGGYIQACRMLTSADLLQDIHACAAPVTVIWGSEDRITPPEDCAKVAAAAGVPGIELSALGHGLVTEDPIRFNAVVRPYIDAYA